MNRTSPNPVITCAKARTVVDRLQMNRLDNNSKGLIAKASISVNAPIARVWDALTNHEVIKQYMFGTKVISDWKEGSPIIWKGEWQGRKYEDRGVILKLEPERLIQYSHFSPLSGLPDVPENYHTVTIELVSDDAQTAVSLSQDNNETEQAREHSEKNWKMMLAGLKKLLENQFVDKEQ
jgi:uncharacterized protein YndB with AHSA1/START domain